MNTETPSAYYASTVAHELAHQRGVAKEQKEGVVSQEASAEAAALILLRRGLDPPHIPSGLGTLAPPL